MFTLNDIPTQEWSDGELVDLSLERRQEMLNAWNVDKIRIEEEKAIEYKKKRLAEYPSIGDQLDALFHAGVFPEDMAAKIQAIKEKYPKS